MSYELRVDDAAVRAISELPADVRRRVRDRITALADEPRPPSAEQLRGALRGVLRLRVGSYRISYTIDESAHAVNVWRIGHRSTFYKRLQGR